MIGRFARGAWAAAGRLRLWLDRRGYWSTTEHAIFEFQHYEPLRRRGLTHRQACDRLEFPSSPSARAAAATRSPS